MSDQQPKPLRLAECLERDCEMNWPDYDNQMDAAAELRRLHDENGRLLQVNLDEHEHFDALMADYIQQSAINAQLLEALEGITGWCQGYEANIGNEMAVRHLEAARAAIAAAKGEA